MAILDALERLVDFVYQLCFQFPVGALTISRQRRPLLPKQASPEADAPAMDEAVGISDRLYDVFQSEESVSSVLAADASASPGDAWRRLYGGHTTKSPRPSHDANGNRPDAQERPSEPLERAGKCGNWGGTKPSRLFLQMYNDAVRSLDGGVAGAMVSPPLMGSSGVLPLTIISVVPDIVRHMSNLIVRAEKEVILATNYWRDSVASSFITNAMKELSRRAGSRGTRIVMKVVYDRGSPKQLFEPHYVVREKEYTGGAVRLPRVDEIPNIDLEVMNYHQPMLGTFHSKYMIVDRRIAVLQSNNIQDNDNLEMMVHLEGPIVDSLYDMALISWHKAPHPPLPCTASTARQNRFRSFDDAGFARMFNSDGTLRGTGVVVDPHKLPPKRAYQFEERTPQQFGTKDDIITLNGNGGEDGLQHSNKSRRRCQASQESQKSSQPTESQRSKQSSLAEHTPGDPHYDEDIAAEVAWAQASVSRTADENHMEAVARKLNHTLNRGFRGAAAPECRPEEEMTPYVPHPEHGEFPVALVCRPPYGPPNHGSASNPQNAAWLSALRHARKNVFIQTPTLNAEPLVPAIAEACERGVDVHCYVCIGYNDAGELLPMQGGHNELVAHDLHGCLSAGGRDHLHYYWYVGKDQMAPIAHPHGRRACHIKLMIVDERVGIVGNGNQDTQSWFHSQEINVMVDSVEVCAAWIAALGRNQNTGLYGRLDRRDGVWRDAGEREVDGAMGVDPGRFSWAKGFVGAVKRFQGTGGF